MNSAIFIDQFSPPSKDHFDLLEYGSKNFDVLYVFITGTRRPRSAYNPWTYNEKVKFLRDYEQRENVIFNPAYDYYYNDWKWANEIMDLDPMSPSTIIGNPYSPLFHEYKQGGPKIIPENKHLDGLSEPVLKDWQKQNEELINKTLLPEKNFYTQYKSKWASAPHPPTFNTVDCLVVCNGNALLIRRQHDPGKNLLSLPGGYIDPDKPLKLSALKELKKETGISIPKKELNDYFKKVKVFDHPLRSRRGRIITHVHFFQINSSVLPPLSAKNARWCPLHRVWYSSHSFFEDHWDIILNMTGNL